MRRSQLDYDATKQLGNLIRISPLEAIKFVFVMNTVQFKFLRLSFCVIYIIIYPTFPNHGLDVNIKNGIQ